MSINKKQNKSRLLKALAFLLLIIIVGLIFYTGKEVADDYIEYKEVEDTQEEIIEQVVDTSSETENEFSIDWDELKSINSDVIAWVRIPNTNISYPVVNSSKYLRKNIYGRYSKGGTPFVDDNIAKPFDCVNTIIYGHNLQNGTVFADLKKYSNQEYANAHSTVYIYLPDNTIRKYTIVSFHIVKATDTGIYNPFVEDVMEYKDVMLSNNVLKNVDIDTNDKIITLSTCTNKGDNRYVLHCKWQDDNIMKGAKDYE